MCFAPNIDIKLFYSGRFNGFGSGGGSKKVRIRNKIFSIASQMCRKFGQKMTFVHKYVDYYRSNWLAELKRPNLKYEAFFSDNVGQEEGQ